MGPCCSNEATFPTPGFEFYRIEDNDVNPSPPTFNVLGTVTGPTSVVPTPVAPTLLQNADWDASVGTAFDYATTGGVVSDVNGADNDNAVLYYWGDNAGNAINIAPAATTQVSQSIVGVPPGAGFPGTTPPASQASVPPSGKCNGTQATIVGTRASETIKGTPKADVIQGWDGKDQIKGLGGNDLICGANGRDTIKGGGGKDTLIGGAGPDKLIGGPGKDRVFGGTPGAAPQNAKDTCVGKGDTEKNCETG